MSYGRSSIFKAEPGAWDRILDGLDEPPKASDIRPSKRRQGITARESKVLTGMLDMIFDSNKGNVPNVPEEEQAGIRKGKVDDFFGRLRRHARLGKWVDEVDAAILDQKKEQIDYCNTDQELLDWAIREVFEESKRFEAAARHAIAEATKSPVLKKEPPRLQPATYPYIIPILMRTFRVKYHDPHLALSIFNYAKSLSIVSYVFGCSTEAYNELFQTKWEYFRDLRGVYESLDEMIVNGVPFNTRTRKWVETVRRDVLNQKERLDTGEASQNEVWELLTKIDQLLVSHDIKHGSKIRWEDWKVDVMKNDKQDDDDWSFDNWGEMFNSKDKRSFRRGTTKTDDAKLPTYNY